MGKSDRHPWCIVAALLLSAGAAAGQEPTTLRGTVTTRAGTLVDGANVYVDALNLGVIADEQGRYVLIVPAATRARSATVEVTADLIGYTTVRQTVTLQPGTQVLDFELVEDPLEITGVVVTALGMERQSRELGVATQQLYGEELTRLEPNLVSTLAGRAAGVNVTNSGPQGGSSYVVIRGENSLDPGKNQPLFVVDGIPVSNDTGWRAGILARGVIYPYDYGNAVQDINPADIESMTILKGPNAAALYGARAANGVILIETKKGRNTPGGVELVVNQQVTFEDELKLPRYQNSYGQGVRGEFSFYDGYVTAQGVNDWYDESWGPPLDWDPDGDGQPLMIPQWFSPYAAACDCREPAPWVSHPSNVDDFFRTGFTSTTNVSLAGSTERLNGRVSFSKLDLEGMLPGHTQDRTSLTLAGGIRASDRLSIDASGQYVTSGGENRPGVGYSGRNVMNGFYWFGRQIDSRRLEALHDQTRPLDEPLIGGYPYSWNTRWWLNPYFQQLVNHNEDERNRLIGQISASYEFTDWLSATLRIGTDWYEELRRTEDAANPQYNPFEPSLATGRFSHRHTTVQETNADLLISASPDLGLPFTTSFSFGGNRMNSESVHDLTWVGALTTPGTFDVSNALFPPARLDESSSKRVNSLYGQAAFGYDDYLFLTLTGRNDWSSTLPESNRSYFYPSVSGSFVFSEVVDDLPFSYLKIRVSWSQVGNDTDPYRIRNTFDAEHVWNNAHPSFSLPPVLQNADLKPETTESWEAGAELTALDGRLGLDLTYYAEETRDQLMAVPISSASGYGSRMMNAGTVQNRGWEILARGTPYLTPRIRWESTLTWSKNWSRVKSLAEGVDGIELSLAGTEYVHLYARVGEPMGQLVADLDYVYAPFYGEPVVGANGLPLVDVTPDNPVIGNVNPDWRAGWSNEVTYGAVRLGFLFDWRQGGDIYSVTKAFGRYAGSLAETATGGRCSFDGVARPGYPVCDAGTGIVFPGLQESSPGSGVFIRNRTPVSQEAYYKRLFFIPRNGIEDGTYIKLRELTLTYRLPSTWTRSWGVNAVDLSLVGRNLWLWTKADHIDPDTSIEGTSVQGFEAGQMPTARSFGMSVTVRM